MGDLVANLLQFSRRGADEHSTVDIREELLKALELVQHHFRKRASRSSRNLRPATPTIHADRQKLRQVFLNLLTNACDAMPQGGTLTLRAPSRRWTAGTPAVQIEFADTGVGIPAEHLERVMEPFFTTKEEGQGTGLGLAICRRVVQEHHGTMQIPSEVGKGTTVRIVLPVKNGTNVDASARRQRTRWTDRQERTRWPKAKLGRLLIVDDEVELMNALCETLADQGYETVGVQRSQGRAEGAGRTGFRHAAQRPDDAGDGRHPAAPQGAGDRPEPGRHHHDGQGTIQTAVEAMKVGAFDYVLKPFNLQTMLPILARAMDVRRLRLENVRLRQYVEAVDVRVAALPD